MTDLETKISLCEEIFKAWKGEIRLSIAEIDTNVKEIQRDFEGFCEINAKNEKKTDEIVGNATRFLSNFQANPQAISSEFQHLIRDFSSREDENLRILQYNREIARINSEIRDKKDVFWRLNEEIRAKITKNSRKLREEIQQIRKIRESSTKNRLKNFRVPLIRLIDELEREKAKRLLGEEKISCVVKGLPQPKP